MEEEKDIKYLMLEDIIENVLSIEKQLDSIQEATKIEGEDSESYSKQSDLNLKFTLLKHDLRTIKQYAESVSRMDKFEDELNKRKYK